MEKELLSEKIRNLADSIGIDTLGFTDASEFTGYALKNSRRQNPKLSLAPASSASRVVVKSIKLAIKKTSFPQLRRA